MIYHIGAYDIDYCVEDEDIPVPNGIKNEEQYIKKEIKRIKSTLPTSMVFDIVCDDLEDLEDLVCDYITETTGWLINGFHFRSNAK